MTDNSKEQLRIMAQELATESIVTKALGRYIEQLVRCLHKDIVRPLEVENARLRAELDKVARQENLRDRRPVPVTRRSVPNAEHRASR